MKISITGISRQDKYFLSKAYELYGILRRNSSTTQGTVILLSENIRKQIIIHYGDITDGNFLSNLHQKEKPEELYYLAAQSFVGYSFQNGLSTYDANIGGPLNVCNAVKVSSPDIRTYFAATSELFGQPNEAPQNKMTQSFPRSPYAV